MGITRDSKHKRRATGGKRKIHRKKRKYEMGRPPSMTKLGAKRIHPVRCRGGRIKFRALRLETGNFSWGTEAVTRKTRLLVVVYNASNNELVRTNTLVKNCVIQIDAAPFRQWYEQHYGILLGKKKKGEDQAKHEEKKPAEKGQDKKKKKTAAATPAKDETKGTKEGEADAAAKALIKSHHVKYKLSKRRSTRVLDPVLEEQFNAGRLYACVTSRPGQSGRCDGYLLEGDELAFYVKKIHAKKKGKGS